MKNINIKQTKMNKLKIVALAFLIASCSKNDPFVDQTNYLEVDYQVAVGIVTDLTVNTDNNAYLFSYDGSVFPYVTTLNKVTPQGQISTETTLATATYGSPSTTTFGLANSSQGVLYWTALYWTALDTNSNRNKVFNFSSNYATVSSYTMSTGSAPTPNTIALNKICNYGDDTFIVYDKANRMLKRYIPSAPTDSFLAGSTANGFTDGTGASAGFGDVSKIVAKNRIIYLIDGNKKYIRKVVENNNNFTVTTLVSNYSDDIIDIGIDANNDLYALVDRKGIYKLSASNQLELFTNRDYPYKYGGIISGGNFQFTAVNRMFIKNNDMYLVAYDSRFYKISNFKSKL